MWHQTASLGARHLEANGIPTVLFGSAKDIVEHAGVPRFVFSDFPLGNSMGKPHDPESQRFTLELGFRTLERAFGSRTTVQSPLIWDDDPTWKLDFSNIDQLSEEEVAARRDAFDKVKQIARDRRVKDGAA